MMTLEELIASDPEPRELKRALAVKMRLQGMKHHQIQPVLGVHSSYISRWESRYRQEGVTGLRSKYKGSKGYLTQAQRQQVKDWIKQEKQRRLWELIDDLEKQYGVVYSSLQSYYDFLKQAGMSWHRGKKKVPDTMMQWYKNTTRSLPNGCEPMTQKSRKGRSESLLWMNATYKPEKFVATVGETVSNDEKLTSTITETPKLIMVRWIA